MCGGGPVFIIVERDDIPLPRRIEACDRPLIIMLLSIMAIMHPATTLPSCGIMVK